MSSGRLDYKTFTQALKLHIQKKIIEERAQKNIEFLSNILKKMLTFFRVLLLCSIITLSTAQSGEF